jgi:hypothetical protein
MGRASLLFSKTEKPMIGVIIFISKWEPHGQRSPKTGPYIAVRHTKEQIAAIKKATPQNLPKAMSYIGRLGIGVRGADRPGFFEEDQLYHLKRDPKEMKNVAYNKAQATRMKEMRKLMQQDLEADWPSLWRVHFRRERR